MSSFRQPVSAARTFVIYAVLPLALLVAFASIVGDRPRWMRPGPIGARRPSPQSALATATGLRPTLGQRAIQVLPVLALPTLIAYFVVWYGREIVGLPPFGDAANHARLARSMIERGPWNTVSPYPPLYHTVAGIALWAGGERGFASVTIAALVLLGIAVYLFANEVTGSRWVAAASTLIAFVSPKLPLYAGRMYMEIPLAALVLVALTFMHRFLRMRRHRDLLLTALVVGLVCLTKQQGLFLFVAGLVYLSGEAAWRVVRGRASLRLGAWPPVVFALVIGVVVVPMALWMFHTEGGLLPDTEFTSGVNHLGARIAGYQAPQEAPIQTVWDDYLQSSYDGSVEAARGQQRAEARHIWPQDVLTPHGFLAIHSTFTQDLVPELNPGVILQLMLIAGLALWVKSPRSRAFVVFSAVWLGINYLSFVRENDQQRYYLYIAFTACFAIPLCAERIGAALRWQTAVGAMVVVGAVIIYAHGYLPGLTGRISANANTQAYAPSVGGIASVRDASAFLDQNLEANKTYYAVPTTEFQYYARRDGLFDYRIYFLNRMTLAHYFADHDVQFVVIPQSAVRPDETWNHIIHLPRSFALKIASIYPIAYQTPARDITVYRVVRPGEIGPLAALDWAAPDAMGFTWPEGGGAVSGDVLVTGFAHDDTGVKQFMFYVDGVYHRGLPGPQDAYTWTWNTRTVANGRHTLSIKAVDGSGNFSTKQITVDVDN